MKKFAYKLVRKINGEYFSYISFYDESRVLQYNIMETTKPKEDAGPLACFSSMETALEYFRHDFKKNSFAECDWKNYALLLCEIVPASEFELWHTYNEYLSGSTFSVRSIPGIVTAWEVKPLAEIPYRKEYEQFAYTIYKTEVIKIFTKDLLGNLHSYDGYIPMKYKFGETTHRPKEHGPLACFKYVHNAVKFMADDYGTLNVEEIPWHEYEIYVCEIVPSKDRDLWYVESPKYTHTMSMEFIDGAITADSVKPVRKVEYTKEEFIELARKFR